MLSFWPLVFKYEDLFSGEAMSAIWVIRLLLITYVTSNILVNYHCFLLTSVILNQDVSPGIQDELAPEYPQSSGKP